MRLQRGQNFATEAGEPNSLTARGGLGTTRPLDQMLQ